MTESMYRRRSPREECHRGVTNASGLVTFTYSKPFESEPAIHVRLIGASSARVSQRVTVESTSSCTIAVQQPTVVSVTGVDVLSNTFENVAGITVCIVASEWV